MTRRPVDCLARIVAAVLAAAPFLATLAHAESAGGIAVSGGLEYSNNPFLLTAKNTDAVRARISVAPFVEERTARSSLRVSGDASFSTYNRRYRDTVDLSTQVGYSARLSQQFSVRAAASVTSSVGSAYATSPIFETPTTANVPPRIIDITVIGSQERTSQAQASAGLTYSVDSRNTISLGYDGSVVRFPRASVRSEYSNLRQSASYSRVINSRANLGASVGVSRVDYAGTRLGDAVIISPSVDGTFRVAAHWTLSASVGFSSSRVNLGPIKLTSTDLSGSGNLCRNDSRTTFCLSASRAAAASAFDGVRTTTTAGLSWSYRVNGRDSFSASGGYSRSSAAKQLVASPPSDYLSATTSYSRRFSSRMTGQVTGGFSRSSFQGTRSSAFASIGINYSFGNQ